MNLEDHPGYRRVMEDREDEPLAILDRFLFCKATNMKETFRLYDEDGDFVGGTNSAYNWGPSTTFQSSLANNVISRETADTFFALVQLHR